MYSKNLKLIFLELINTYLLLYIYCKRVETHRENHKGDTKVTRGRGRSNIPSYRPRVVNHNDLDPGRQWSNLVCSHKRRLIFFFIGMIAILRGKFHCRWRKSDVYRLSRVQLREIFNDRAKFSAWNHAITKWSSWNSIIRSCRYVEWKGGACHCNRWCFASRFRLINVAFTTEKIMSVGYVDFICIDDQRRLVLVTFHTNRFDAWGRADET